MAALLFWGVAAQAKSSSYYESLAQALEAMEAGKHAQAIEPLKAALMRDRNEPLGLLALGTLYLHTGSPTRAAAEFERAEALAPGDALVRFGIALAALAGGKPDAAAFAALPLAPARTAAVYVRLMAGEAARVRAELAEVTPDGADPLRLQIAAFAALRSGDGRAGRRCCVRCSRART